MTNKIELYQPSNGTEGDIFMERFCFRCSRCPKSPEANNQCLILGKTFAFNIGDAEYPRQWRYVDDKPECTSFNDRELANTERRDKLKTKTSKSLNLF